MQFTARNNCCALCYFFKFVYVAYSNNISNKFIDRETYITVYTVLRMKPYFKKS